jgi:hypothetical protein
MLVNYELLKDGEWYNDSFVTAGRRLKLDLIETDKSSLGNDLLLLAGIFLNPEDDHKMEWEALGLFPGADNIPTTGDSNQPAQEEDNAMSRDYVFDQKGNTMRDIYIFDWNKAARILRERKPSMATAYIGGMREHTEVSIWVNHGPLLGCNAFLLSHDICGYQPRLDCGADYATDCAIKINDTDDWGPDTWWPESAIDILKGKMTVMEEFDGPWHIANRQMIGIEIKGSDGNLKATAATPKLGPLISVAPDMLEALEMAIVMRDNIRCALMDYGQRNVVRARWNMLEQWDAFSHKAQAAVKKARGDE